MQIHTFVDAIKRIALRQKVSPNALRFLYFILYIFEYYAYSMYILAS